MGRKIPLADIHTQVKRTSMRINGTYSQLPRIIRRHVSTANLIGYDFWAKTTAATPQVKNIVKELLTKQP
jgi:hypothetical protein